ncbi:MAG: lipoate--protein ligase family protein [Tannerella sp.]|jgi:lipoate-protein ligase A|nr:lipoate--protein ligase family protein [Tannerella sp.]
MLLLRSMSGAPSQNGALERRLLSEQPGAPDRLLFYINRPSVIVGRNQRIEAEVDTAYCRRQGIEVFRRISGGGAVYQDYGNINYAFVCGKTDAAFMDMDFATPIRDALRAFGITATVGTRGELLAGGRKISGTAAHVMRSRILFHGTLLYRTDLRRMSRALQGDSTLRGRCIASVPAPVVNLSDLTGSSESTTSFLEKLLLFFEDRYGVETALALCETSVVAATQL